jgi:hypothetical protein
MEGIYEIHCGGGLRCHDIHIATDLINGLPGNSSVNTVQHATIEEAVFSADLTNAPID